MGSSAGGTAEWDAAAPLAPGAGEACPYEIDARPTTIIEAQANDRTRVRA
jgi:hypothetical protein